MSQLKTLAEIDAEKPRRRIASSDLLPDLAGRGANVVKPTPAQQAPALEPLQFARGSGEDLMIRPHNEFTEDIYD